MDDRRSPPATDWILIFVGVIGFVTVIGRLLNPIEYPPADFRSQDWFIVGSTALLLFLGSVFLLAGLVRLWRRGA